MQKNNGIENYSWSYSLLKKYIVFLTNRYYRISIANKSYMKPGDHLIYAPNHQNALMDALALHAALSSQPIFMARSDIFAKKTIARILTFLKILPIYRIRDGYDQLSNNQQVFKQTFSVLDNKSSLAIFPEGSHDGTKKLRTLKKGIARIAFSYRHETPEYREIKIVPVGINYLDYHSSGSGLLVRFGKAVSISDFDSEYNENPARAINSFIQALEDELKKNMLHIEEDEAANTCEILLQTYASIAESRGESHESIFITQKEIIAWVEATFKEQPVIYQKIETIALEMYKILEQKNIPLKNISLLSSETQPSRIFSNGLLLVFTSPLYFFALVQNLLPGLLMKKISSLTKDPQFKSSVALVGIAFIYPLFYLLQTLIFGLISAKLSWTIFYFISLPLSLLVKKSWESLWQIFQNVRKLAPISNSLSQLLQEIKLMSGFRF